MTYCAFESLADYFNALRAPCYGLWDHPSSTRIPLRHYLSWTNIKNVGLLDDINCERPTLDARKLTSRTKHLIKKNI